MSNIKMSINEWNKLTTSEQEYVKQRAPIVGVSDAKMILREARKQHPDYVRIYGKGFIEMPDGTIRLWGGYDLRKFYPITF